MRRNLGICTLGLILAAMPQLIAGEKATPAAGTPATEPAASTPELPTPVPARNTQTENPIDADLQEAWKLYNFSEFKNADRIFASTLENEGASPDQKLQARIGRIFIIQYRQPGSDPATAFSMYQDILKDMPDNHQYRGLVLSRMAACCIESKTPDPEKGRKYLAQAILASPKGSLLQQECAIQMALSHLQVKPGKNDIRLALRELQKNMPLLKGGLLEGAAHNLAAGMALLLDNPKLMEKELEAWVRAGIQNFTFRAVVYFKIARINELVTRNFDKARKYYEKLAREEPSDSRSYFSRTRAREIADGKIWNGDLALPRSAFKRETGSGKDRTATGNQEQ